MSSLIVWDLDGVLADNRHRLSYILGDHPDWDAYKRHMHEDSLVTELAAVARALFHIGHTQVVVTGRMDDERHDTRAWMSRHYLLYLFDEIRMRPVGDHRRALVVKREILEQLRGEGHTITLMFEDNPATIEMVREMGILVLDPGGRV